jgi:hypothetical protein
VKKGEINDISTLLIIESFGRFTLQMAIFFFHLLITQLEDMLKKYGMLKI